MGYEGRGGGRFRIGGKEGRGWGVWVEYFGIYGENDIGNSIRIQAFANKLIDNNLKYLLREIE